MTAPEYGDAAGAIQWAADRHYSNQTSVYINDCQHSFEELAWSVLPSHMRRLTRALTELKPTSMFAQVKVGPATVARQCGLASDFSGCYVLVDGDRPIYVGISRKVLSRLRQHVRGQTHFDASFAYAIAQRREPTPGGRDAAMATPKFREAFDQAKEYLRSLSVAFIPIENPLELYVFEVYASMSLGTHEWNTFRTH